MERHRQSMFGRPLVRLVNSVNERQFEHSPLVHMQKIATEVNEMKRS
jgi:hypothetical protein